MGSNSATSLLVYMDGGVTQGEREKKHTQQEQQDGREKKMSRKKTTLGGRRLAAGKANGNRQQSQGLLLDPGLRWVQLRHKGNGRSGRRDYLLRMPI